MDALKVAIGGVLSQGGRPVAYFSEKLTESKSRYTTYDLEFYSVVQAVKHWRHYLFHKEFVLFTGHDSLRHIRTQDKVSHKHGRWLAFLKKFTFVVKHKTGVSNRAADALSRRSNLLVSMQVDVLGMNVIHEKLSLDPYISIVLQGLYLPLPAWDQKLCQESAFQVVYFAQPCRHLDLMPLPVSGYVPKKVQDFVKALREVHKAIRGNLDHFLVGEYNKLSAKKIRSLEIVEKINFNAYRLKLPSHIRCSDVFNVKHFLPYHGDSSNDDLVGSEGEESENLFFESGGSSSDEESDQPRRDQRDDNRRWESGMRVNILEFNGNTFNPERFIDWLVAVEEVFEFKEVPENKRDSLIATKLRGRASAWWKQLKMTRERVGKPRIMDSINMFDPMTLSNAYQRALAIANQNRRVKSSSSHVITEGSFGSGNVTYRFVPNQTKVGGGNTGLVSKGFGSYGLKCFNCGEPDTYFDGVNITLMPNNPKELVNKPTGTLLTLSQFQDELETGGDVFVLIGKEVAKDSKVPEAMISLLKEFFDVFPNELHYRMSPREHEELRWQVEELVSKGHIRESMSPCAVPTLLTTKKDGSWRIGATIFTKLDLKSGYYQIRLRPSDEWKTAFKMREGLYEWYVVSGEGIHVDESKVSVVREWLTPTTISKVQTSYGCLKGCNWGVLSQGGRHVAYFSEKLTKPKSSYSTYDPEFYAVVQAVKHWCHYLFHKDFVLFTDHDSLRHIRTQDKVSHKHGCWLTFIEKFTFVVKHKSGVSYRAADAFSRRSNLLVSMQVDVPRLDVIHEVSPLLQMKAQAIQQEPDATSFGDFSNREWQIGVIFESTPLFLITYQQTRCGGSLETSVGTNTQSGNVPASRGSHILQNKEDIYCLEDYTAQESSISQIQISGIIPEFSYIAPLFVHQLSRTWKAKTRRRLKILSNQSMRLMITNNSRKEGRSTAFNWLAKDVVAVKHNNS
ncbi:putative reverse transcriptase domain-containing protein [Tanacetum coccineum]